MGSLNDRGTFGRAARIAGLRHQLHPNLRETNMSMPSAASPPSIVIDRDRPMPLAEQITVNLRDAIVEGRLEPGARLPSWLDMATQLGVARGTVKTAYERLTDEALVVSSGAAGTRVAEKPISLPAAIAVDIPRPMQGIERGFYLEPLPFQMGVPAQDAAPPPTPRR